MKIEEWLGSDNTLGIDIWKRKYQYENETLDEWFDRVSGGDEALKTLIKEKKFLFGGRALSNRRTDNVSSMFNCYSRGFIQDDIKDILKANTDIALTYKSQGGQGLSLSKIRPKGSPIGNRYVSDGIIPFMRMYNSTTSTISQGGSRKGALMISLDARHKEVEDFITVKSNDTELSKANLSLEIDDVFMEAVDKYYETGEEVILHEKRVYGTHTVEYDICPIKIYKLMCEYCYNWADPACIYADRFRTYNLMEFVKGYDIETCNPCGEQPMPKNFSCNLGSLNLYEFVNNKFQSNAAFFDFEQFDAAIGIAIKALDDIIDENANNHALEAQKNNSLNYRNIGLGVFGYADMLMALGLKYGSDQAKLFTGNLFGHMFRQSVLSDIALAEKTEPFKKYSPKMFDSKIMKNHFSKELIKALMEENKGFRNCSLLSIAPTGSIATMLGRSGGCEPEFALKYTRKTESLNNGEDKYYDIYCSTVLDFVKETGGDVNNLPDYFVTSKDINYRDRIDTQSIMQYSVDTAISSTVNLPESATIDEVEDLYLFGWKSGLKGITIYRDNCARTGILSTEKNKENKPVELKRGEVVKINDNVIGLERHITTGCGTIHLGANFNPNTGELVETYANRGSKGGCLSNITGVSRLISLAARGGINIHNIVDQLESAIQCPSYTRRTAVKHDTSPGLSCCSAISRALIDMYNQFNGIGKYARAEGDTNKLDSLKDEMSHKNDKSIKPIKTEVESDFDQDYLINNMICPQCGNNLIKSGGCYECRSCGFSKCD